MNAKDDKLEEILVKCVDEAGDEAGDSREYITVLNKKGRELFERKGKMRVVDARTIGRGVMVKDIGGEGFVGDGMEQIG